MSPRQSLKWFGYTIVVLLLATVAAAATVAAVPSQIPKADFRVIDGACESGRGRVTGLTILVATPGVIELSWDNDVICGKPA